MALTSVAIQQFKDMFTNQYAQAEKKLAGAFMEYRGLVGDAYKMPVVEEVVMQTRGAFHSDIAQQVASYANKIITFENYATNLPSDIFEQTEIVANERQNYARIAAEAIARTEDQVGLNALNATTSTKSVAVGTTNLTLDKIRAAAYELDYDNVPSTDRFWVAHVNQKASLLNETETTSTDYNSVKTLVNGNIDSFYGFKFIWFGDLSEGGLYKTGDNRTNFAFHKSAMAYGYRMNPTVAIEWDGRSQSWLIIPKVSLGSSEVLPKGIVKVVCDETQ